MPRWTVTIERILDNRRFRRIVSAGTEMEAFREADRSLGADALDYYVVCIVRA